MTEPEKQCRKCLAFKPLGEFNNDKSKKDGKKPACKCCTREYSRQYRAENPEKARESQRQYRAENPEKVKESNRQYRAENPEEIKEKNSKRYAANPEKWSEAQRKRRAVTRHARNQCAVINALDPKKWELLEAKLKTLNPLRK